MSELELIERAILRKEFELRELFKDITRTQQYLKSAKLVHKVIEEDYKLDSLVHFCVNGKYPDE